MKQEQPSPSTRKVRRLVRGGKRGPGHEWQARGKRVRRPDPRAIEVATTETTLTSVAGLVEFGAFVRSVGLRAKLRERFAHLKTGSMVVYPMHEQIQLVMDLHVAGEGRVFGLESLAHDPLFVALAGGAVPSVDTVYDDFGRCGPDEIVSLESVMADEALAELRRVRPSRVHVDIDTTVTELFGTQEGAVPGPNPRYHGRPSYHPILVRVAEVDGIVGAELRPGDTSFGADDAPTIGRWLDRLREAVGPGCVVVVRIDAAADCAEILRVLEDRGVHYEVKARITPDLAGAIAQHGQWHTVDEDAFGKPTRQVAVIDFQRQSWREVGISVRVVAVRSRDRDNGKQLYLWNDLDYTVQAYLTNDWLAPADDVARLYDARAGIEPIIGELKRAWCIGKAPSASFNANHAAFLAKLLAYNAFRRFVAAKYAPLAKWRTPWARRAIVLRPGRICRSGRSTTLRTTPVVVPMLC
jgi:hypothetical protein